MGDARPFVENVVLLRRALYELQRQPNANPKGVTKTEILTYMAARRYPSMVNDFDEAVARLMTFLAEGSADGTEIRYRLNHNGLVEEETVGIPGRRPRLVRALDELGKPERIAGAVVTLAAVILGFVLGRIP